VAVTTTLDFPVQLPVVKRGEHWYARAGERTLRLSNLDKLYWPDDGYTKGDLLSYYLNVSPVMMPHLIERPLTLKRTRIRVQAEGKTINYLSVCDVAHVLWVANLGCIEFHPLHARGRDQLHPSYAFFETSGATGMQIMVPLDGSHDFADVRSFIGGVADLVHAADPETTTMEWEVSKRAGKVFLDVNMNREGATIAAAYSVRPEPGAPVSTPLDWGEIGDVHPRGFTIATIFERIDDVGDLFLPVAEGPAQSLNGGLAQLDAQTPNRKRRN
jgi:bifunctional non-homologous end joining protein LigD